MNSSGWRPLYNRRKPTSKRAGKVCKVEGCGKPVHHLGRMLCSVHNSRYLRRRPMEGLPPKPRRAGKVCKVESCGRPVYHLGLMLCLAHYKRHKRGAPLEGDIRPYRGRRTM